MSAGQEAPGRILVTGGSGFIGSALVRHLVGKTDHAVLNVDKLTYAASGLSLSAVEGHARYAFRRLDICDGPAMARAFADFRPTAVMHLAAESHVDRSIDAPEAFVTTNVVGTLRVLEAARHYWAELDRSGRERFRFLHVSTDEVFGSLDASDPPFSDATRYRPRSPYAASKAGSDHLVRAWHHTFGLPVIVTNCTNNYGPYQFPEKLIPLVIIKALRGETLPVYGSGANIRDWLFVDDHVEALTAALERGRPGMTYLLGGGEERTNLDVVAAVADLVNEMAQPLGSGRRRSSLIALVPDRPGHDFRYAVDIGGVERALGWRPARSFEEGLRTTVRWFLDNESWWAPLLERYRGERLGAPAGRAGC